MSFSYSNHAIESLKDQINIVDVIGRCVTLKRAGSNYKGVCPFHNEKTPSFVVSEQKQIFTCFGCGATGDVIEFVKRYYNLDFSEAVEKLAGEYGITLEKRQNNDNREVYYKVNKLAANFFYKAFTETANKGYAYMKRRGISPAILKKFGIGYADEKWDSLYQYLLSQGIETKIMLELGLISESKGKYYDKFRNRVIFPIINTSGKVIGFGGRAIHPDDNPKYLNSPESKIFQKKNNLYGLNTSRQNVGKAGYIILVEGYMDTIALYQAGVENVAASLGTALTENQARLIKRYTKNVVLSYDADSAGRAAALRGLDILKSEDCRVKVLHVTDGKDPDEYIKKNGKSAFLNLVENALPYGDYKLESAKIGFDLSKDEDRIDYIKAATEIIGRLSPVEQEIYIPKLAKDMKVSESAIRMELSPDYHAEAPKQRQYENQQEEEILDILPIEKTLIKIMLTNADFVERVRQYDGLFQSGFGIKLFDIFQKEFEENKSIDEKKVLDSLSPQGASKLQEIMDYIVLGGNEEQVFSDCISTWTDRKLEAEEKRLLTLLSMADEEDNGERIKQLTDQLMKVQKDRKNNSRGI